MTKYYDAARAAELLGVSRSTLYAYVSRGKIRSAPDPDSGRARRYLAADVDRLARAGGERRDPTQATRRALDWGRPVLATSIAEIDGRALRYRGVDACRLARERTFEDVASLLWKTQSPPTLTSPPSPSADDVLARAEGLPLMKRCQIALATAEHLDVRAFMLDPRHVARTGESILRWMVAAREDLSELTPGEPVARALARAWEAPAWAEPTLNAALVLCADHGLNASTFAARVAASAGATPYGAAQAGLAALLGRRHAGITARIAALFDEAERAASPLDALLDRLRRGAAIPGFAHPLYPDGDPRARLLLDALAHHAPDHPVTSLTANLCAAAAEILDDGHPSVDLALTSLARTLGRPDDALYLFALGRAAGWIAHTMEQYADGSLLRPRSEYRR
jgi:citrate synthase